MTARAVEPRHRRRLRSAALIAALALASCTRLMEAKVFPPLEPGTPSFFPTVAAHTDARFVDGRS